MFNFVADAEATAERNFRTGILARAANKPSTGRTSNIVERNDATRPRTCIDDQPQLYTVCRKNETTARVEIESEREREREREKGGKPKREKRERKEGMKKEDRKAINTIGIEYRKAPRDEEKRERERGISRAQKARRGVDVFRAELA